MVNIQENIFLKPYTTFKIGGSARYFAVANSTEEAIEYCRFAKERGLPIFALGGGSNILISDKGFNGLTIKIRNSKFEIRNSSVIVDAGVPLAKVVAEVINAGLSGLEWAMGIPGTVGGAINGNAGAFGKSISGSIEKIKVFDIANLKAHILKNEECKFSYRNSIFKRNPNLIILSAIINLKKGNRDETQMTVKDFIRQRMESNPSGYSAGSFFKNPGWEEVRDKKEIISKFPELKQFSDKPKIPAYFLIESLGLKGKKIGEAAVSDKHANFILNLGNATAEQVIILRDLIKERVHLRYGFNLEDEVILVGF